MWNRYNVVSVGRALSWLNVILEACPSRILLMFIVVWTAQVYNLISNREFKARSSLGYSMMFYNLIALGTEYTIAI